MRLVTSTSRAQTSSAGNGRISRPGNRRRRALGEHMGEPVDRRGQSGNGLDPRVGGGAVTAVRSAPATIDDVEAICAVELAGLERGRNAPPGIRRRLRARHSLPSCRRLGLPDRRASPSYGSGTSSRKRLFVDKVCDAAEVRRAELRQGSTFRPETDEARRDSEGTRLPPLRHSRKAVVIRLLEWEPARVVHVPAQRQVPCQ